MQWVHKVGNGKRIGVHWYEYVSNGSREQCKYLPYYLPYKE